MTTSNSSATAGAHSQQPKQGDGETATGVDLKARGANWAERWFAGAASCPVCGGDDMDILRTQGEGTFLIEQWRCATSGCLGRWRIEWRESAAGIDDDADDLEADWYERETDSLKFQIVVEDGIVTGVGAAPGSVVSDPFPHFIVRNYETRGFDGKQVSGIDETGRPYTEHEVSMMPNQSCGDPNVCSLLVASTAHVTAEEAQFLTDHGYARGQYGFFFYAAGEPNVVLTELGALSGGLQGVIREAHGRGCQYVLLDRDGPLVSGIPIYPW
jgi:hypothetical protein